MSLTPSIPDPSVRSQSDQAPPAPIPVRIDEDGLDGVLRTRMNQGVPRNVRLDVAGFRLDPNGLDGVLRSPPMASLEDDLMAALLPSVLEEDPTELATLLALEPEAAPEPLETMPEPVLEVAPPLPPEPETVRYGEVDMDALVGPARPDDSATVLYADDSFDEEPAVAVVDVAPPVEDTEGNVFELPAPTDLPAPARPVHATPVADTAPSSPIPWRGVALAAAVLLVPLLAAGAVGVMAIGLGVAAEGAASPRADVTTAAVNTEIVAVVAQPHPTPEPPPEPTATPEPAPEARPLPDAIVPVQFDVDGVAPAAETAALTALVRDLQGCERIIVTGHTCSLGAAEVNEWVGLERARVMTEVLARHGVKAPMTARSAGEREPVADNRNRAGRQANRRVTVTCISSAN